MHSFFPNHSSRHENALLKVFKITSYKRNNSLHFDKIIKKYEIKIAIYLSTKIKY